MTEGETGTLYFVACIYAHDHFATERWMFDSFDSLILKVASQDEDARVLLSAGRANYLQVVNVREHCVKLKLL